MRVTERRKENRTLSIQKRRKFMKTGKRKYAMSAAFAAFLALSAVSPIAAAYEDNDVDYQFHILKQ